MLKKKKSALSNFGRYILVVYKICCCLQSLPSQVQKEQKEGGIFSNLIFQKIQITLLFFGKDSISSHVSTTSKNVQLNVFFLTTCQQSEGIVSSFE